MEKKIALAVRDLKINYGAIEAVKGINIEVPEGSAVALLGANGAGKSSVIRSISGVTPISGGSITYYDQEISRMTPEKITRLGIAKCPEGRQIFASLTTEENLLAGAFTLKDRAKRQECFEKVYNYFPRLKERRKQIAGTMSGGELQMLAIGRALMGDPKVILFDEPSLGLAPLIVEEMFRVIREIRQEGITVLLVEQNALQAMQVVDYVYVLTNGVVTVSGPSEQLIGDSSLVEAYLGK